MNPSDVKKGQILRRSNLIGGGSYTIEVTEAPPRNSLICGRVVDPGEGITEAGRIVMAPAEFCEPVYGETQDPSVVHIDAAAKNARDAFEGGYAHAREEFDRRYDSIVWERNDARSALSDANARLEESRRRVERLRKEIERVQRQRDEWRGSDIARSRENGQLREQLLEATDKLEARGGPRSVLIQLTPPGVEPSPNALSWCPKTHSSLLGEADLAIAAAVDDSYVKCIKNRWGSTDDVEIKVRWER